MYVYIYLKYVYKTQKGFLIVPNVGFLIIKITHGNQLFSIIA